MPPTARALALPSGGPVRVEAVDLLGPHAPPLYDDVLEAGPSSLPLATAALVPGRYRLRVTTTAGVAYVHAHRAGR